MTKAKEVGPLGRGLSALLKEKEASSDYLEIIDLKRANFNLTQKTQKLEEAIDKLEETNDRLLSIIENFPYKLINK